MDVNKFLKNVLLVVKEHDLQISSSIRHSIHSSFFKNRENVYKSVT